MRVLLDSQLEEILASAQILYGDKSKPQLIVDASGMAYKFFHPPKKLISSKTFRPPAKRFIKNALELNKRGINAPIVEETLRGEHSKCLILKYAKLDGIDYREKISIGHPAPLDSLPSICADLHRKGVYFRAIHLGNILHQPNGQYALIDISDCQLSRGTLGAYKRARNIAHLITYSKDKTAFNQYSTPQFIEDYLCASGLHPLKQILFKRLLGTKGIQLAM